MNLPELEKPEKYVGLYIFDFGDHAGVGFTAEEIAELLESEKYKDGKVYKIHKAYPDGRLEIKGVTRETFQLEAGETVKCIFTNTKEAAATVPGMTTWGAIAAVTLGCALAILILRRRRDELT